MGTHEDRIIRAVRYTGGTRVTIKTANDCKGLFFMLEMAEEGEENELKDNLIVFKVFLLM